MIWLGRGKKQQVPFCSSVGSQKPRMLHEMSSFNFWDSYLNVKEENRAFSKAKFGEHFSLSSLSH